MAGTKAGAAKRLSAQNAVIPGGTITRTESTSPVSVLEDLGTTTEPSPIWYVVGRKPLRHGQRTFQVGEKFPHVDKILRLEAWVRSGWLVPMS